MMQFTLHGHKERDNLLPEGHVLIADLTREWLLWLEVAGGLPIYHGGIGFTQAEWTLALPLLEAYPDYFPYEKAYASFNYNTMDEATVARARKQLYAAFEKPAEWDFLMRPLRNIMSRVRVKLVRELGLLDIRTITETGFLLRPVRTSTEGGASILHLQGKGRDTFPNMPVYS